MPCLFYFANKIEAKIFMYFSLFFYCGVFPQNNIFIHIDFFHWPMEGKNLSFNGVVMTIGWKMSLAREKGKKKVVIFSFL